MASSYKKTERNQSESNSENETADFPRSNVIESLEDVCLTKFSLFLIEKVSTLKVSTPKNVNKIRNWNLFFEVESILKMKIFHTTKFRAYPHEKLNTSKGVIPSRELALATEEEMSAAQGKHRVTNIKWTTIRKGEEKIETNAYILTFNQPQIPKELKLGYCVERVEQCVPAPLRCFKYQKYGHHREAYWQRHTCAKYS